MDSFVKAHKLATGYFQDNLNREKTRALSKNQIEEDYRNYSHERFFKEYGKEKPLDNTEEIKEVTLAAKVGANLKVIRDYRKMTREELFTKTGISVDTIGRIESGKNKNINYENLIKISVACMCTLDFLLGNSCDPVSDASGEDVFYGLDKTFIQNHVDVGHDLAYVANYMEDQSKELVKCLIDNLNLMHKQKKINDSLNKKPLSLVEVYVREQKAFRLEHSNRGCYYRLPLSKNRRELLSYFCRNYCRLSRLLVY